MGRLFAYVLDNGIWNKYSKIFAALETLAIKYTGKESLSVSFGDSKRWTCAIRKSIQ